MRYLHSGIAAQSGLLSLMLLFASVGLVAQEPSDLQASMECFARKAYSTGAPCEPGVLSADAYLTPGKYSRATVEAVLDGLEELALSSGDGVVQRSAVVHIGMVGLEKYDVGIAIVPRLARIYERSDWSIKATTVKMAGAQANRQAAAEFLGRVARDHAEPAGYAYSLPEAALLKLAGLGEQGRAVLRLLAAEDGVQDPRARSQLRALQRRNWRLDSL